MSKPRNSPATEPSSAAPLAHRHLLAGWWALLIFLTLGIGLEALHGFKVAAYLGVSNETRRLMWTLAHAHGTLLGLINLGFAFTLRSVPQWPASSRGLASATLLGATLLIPAGFFLGGVNPSAGDPGLGILLLPIGGLMLLAAVLLTALTAARHRE
jgi:hypothetical protein